MSESKYYVMTNKFMADAISYILGESYYIFNDRFNKGKKVYSFKDDTKFREVLTLVSNARNKYNQFNKSI